MGFFISGPKDLGFMDIEFVLKDLKEDFPGQRVLYVNHLATLLDKTESAIQSLLERGGLPFTVKRVGSHRCVDIYQVAQWLASVGEQENPPQKPTAEVQLANSGKKKSFPDLKNMAPMAAQIFQMRHDSPNALAKFAAQLADQDERIFMTEVAASMMFSHAAVSSPYMVQVCRRAPVAGGSLNRGDDKVNFDDYASAERYLARLRMMDFGDADVRLTLKRGKELLHHSFCLGGKWHKVEVLKPLRRAS